MDFKFLQRKEGKITRAKEIVEQTASTKEIFQTLTQEEIDRKKQELEHYYVPYEVESLQKGFEITIFPVEAEESSQLAIKYGINNENETIILASTKEKTIRTEMIRRELNKYFGEKVQNYASLKELQPEFYIEYLIKQGWELTQEGMDLFTTVQNDGQIEIKRTEFTSNELESITKQDIEENQHQHKLRREQQIIDEIPEYIVKSYKQITSEDIKQMATTLPIEKVLQPYKMVLGYLNQNGENELAQIFGNMKPICELMQDSQMEIHEDMSIVSQCMNQIPMSYRDNEKQQEILQYMIIRKAFMQEKQKGVRNSQQQALDSYISRIDKKEEDKQVKTRKEMEESVKTLMDRHSRGWEM